MVLVEDIKTYEQFLHDTAFKLPGVTHIRSSVVLKEVKAAAGVPIAAAQRRRRARRASEKRAQGLTKLRTNSSFGTGGSGSSRSRGSAGLRRKRALGVEPEARRLDLAAQERLLDAVQRRRHRDAGAGPARVVGDDVDAARLQRPNTAAFMRARSIAEVGRGRGS